MFLGAVGGLIGTELGVNPLILSIPLGILVGMYWNTIYSNLMD